MFRKIIVGVFLLIAGVVVAQEGTTSPYSFYGVGILQFRGTAENRAMGGIGVFSDSIHLNLKNPAGYAGLKLVNFSMGASLQNSTQKTDTESQGVSTTSFDYLAMGIPMGKFGMGFGIMPYTTVGYHFFSDTGQQLTDYTGNGGINKAFLSLGYQITPDLALGVDGSYNFGKIEGTAISQHADLQYGTRTYSKSEIYGFSFKVGAIYKKMITDKLELTGSATFTPGTDFKSDNYKRVATVSIMPTGIITVDERKLDLGQTTSSIPSLFSVGAGISKPKNWGVAAEYTFQKTSSFNNESFPEGDIVYQDASKFSLGGYYIPNYTSFGNYLERVTYRAGMRYQQTGFTVDGHDINEFGISFGLGLPVGRLFSNFNLGVELGQRGTTDFGLIQENFFNTFLSFSLNDRWFEKRFID